MYHIKIRGREKTPPDRKVDIFTYNWRIAMYIEARMGVLAGTETDDTEGEEILYKFTNLENKIKPMELDRFVDLENPKSDLELFGGYEIRDNSTGEFIILQASARELHKDLQ